MSTDLETRPPLERVVVLIPTYNERENLPRIVARVRSAVPAVDILVVDDNSPDGTGAVADGLAGTDPHVHVLHRAGKEGLGAAYLAGFAWALDRGYDTAVEMDADGSHQPEQLPALLAAAEHADLVIGSRWVSGARSSTGRCPARSSRSAATSTSGSCWACRSTTPPVATASTAPRRCTGWTCTPSSRRYGFQVDMTWRAVGRG